MATRNLFVRAGFDASGMSSGTRQANNALRQFGQNVNKQMSSLSNTVSSSMSKIGKLLAGAFAVGAIVNFGKQAAKAFNESSVASAKLEKVMKNTMGATSEHIEGIKKLIADQELGGVVGGDIQFAGAQELGTYLTEAESLKKIIPIMNDMAAQQFGLEATAESVTNIATMLGKVMNGQVGALSRYGYSFTKAQEKILKFGTEAERAAVLVEVVSDSVGGMNAALLQTPTGQIRQLQFALDGVKSAIGEGIMSAVQAALPALNAMAKVLLKVAQAFSAFMQAIFGKTIKMQDTQISGTQDQVSAVESLGDAADDAGENAKKAGKKAKGALASFDELNQLSSTSDSSSSGSSGGSGLDNMGGAVEVDLGETVEQADKLTTMFDGVIAQLTKMKDLFSAGFKIGFETANLDALNSAIANIKTGFMNVFGDGSILSSFTNMLKSMALSAGATVGAYASIGVTIATNLIGGIGNYLNQNAQYIKDRLIGIFDARAEISSMWTEYAIVFADIFSVFGGKAGQQITANIIGMFSNGFLGILELATKLGRDIMKCITKPIVDNKESLKKALEGTLEVISVVTGTLKDLITNTMKKAVEVYDEYLRPAFKNIESGISQIVSAMTDAYNTYIQPTLMKMAKSWDDFYNDSLKPVIDKTLDVFGKLVEGVSEIWKKTLAPFVAWAIDVLAPYLATAFENISEAFKTAGEIILGIVDSLLTVFDGLIDFVVGVFTGDWKRAWEGIKTVFKGIVDSFEKIFIEPLNKVLTWVKEAFVRSWGTYCNTFSSAWSNAWESMKTGAKKAINWIIDKMNGFINGINSKLKFELPEIMGGATIGFSIPNIPKLARGGIVTSPTIAQIGEAGPEMVVPLENTSFVDKLASAVGNAVMSAMSTNMSMGDSYGKGTVIELDGRQVGRAIASEVFREANRVGLRLE